jgi:hypothetical protein
MLVAHRGAGERWGKADIFPYYIFGKKSKLKKEGNIPN